MSTANTDSSEFEHMIQQLYQTIYQDPSQPISVQLYELISQNDSYRGALVLLMAKLLELPPVPEQIDCQQCLDQLAAFVDYEIDYGTRAAAHQYASIWWSLWTCPECLESYLTMHALHKAVETGEIIPLSPLQPPLVQNLAQQLQAPLIVVFKLPRHFLNRVLSPRPQLGTAMSGEQEHETVLARREIVTESNVVYFMTLSIEQQDDTRYQIIVNVAPPSEGIAIVKLGATVFHAQFDQQGRASTPTIPAIPFAEPEGPELEVEVQLKESAKKNISGSD
jgi:hypothetical protein